MARNSSHGSSDSAPLAVGSVVTGIADYTLGRRLGAGEMGEVFAAATPDGAQVAIKFLKLAAAGANLETRFRREAMLCAALQHPNIVSVRDHGVYGSTPFLVMPLLRGQDLEAWIQRTGPLRPEVAVAIMLQACAGIRAAHHAGVIHRDLKPANVFLDESADGELRAVICDFGIAKVYDEDGAITASGAVLGTPLYMAPEQLLDSKRVDGRCDVWALGMILYTTLTGRPAFEHGTLADILLALHEARVPPLQERAPWVPPALARIVHAALLPHDRRITTVRELEDALLRWAPAAKHVTRTDLTTIPDERKAQLATRANLPARASELDEQGDDTVGSDSSFDASIPDANLGRVFADRYRVVARIGSGGMGAVYEAVDVSTSAQDPVVALKIMQPTSGSRGAESTRRFLREAKASAKIESPHVTRFIDSAVDGATGCPFIVMERLRGMDLSTHLERSGALEPAAAITIFLQACDALSAAHVLGIVHRDIKPSNLFLHRDATSVTLKVCDFGIAKQLVTEGDVGQSTELTRTGGIIGSPLYMSPEQAKSSKNVDQRSDIFSLALTMHEALSGRRPWEGRTSMGEIIVAVCTEDVPLLSAVAPWTDAGLSAVIAKALARNVDDRYTTISELAAALAPFGARRTLAQEDLVGVPSRRREDAIAYQAATLAASRAHATGDAVSITANREPQPNLLPKPRRWAAITGGVVFAAVAGVAALALGGSSVLHGRPDAALLAPSAPIEIASTHSAEPRLDGGSGASLGADAAATASALASATSSAPRPRADPTPSDGRRPRVRPPAAASAGAAPVPAPASPASSASVGRGFTATDLPQ